MLAAGLRYNLFLKPSHFLKLYDHWATILGQFVQETRGNCDDPLAIKTITIDFWCSGFFTSGLPHQHTFFHSPSNMVHLYFILIHWNMLSKWLRMNEYIYSNLGNDSIGTLSFESLIFLKSFFFYKTKLTQSYSLYNFLILFTWTNLFLLQLTIHLLEDMQKLFHVRFWGVSGQSQIISSCHWKWSLQDLVMCNTRLMPGFESCK